MPDQTAQISWNEAGFWQGDLFPVAGEEPDDFFTLAKGKTADDAIVRAREKWPAAHVFVVEEDNDEENED